MTEKSDSFERIAADILIAAISSKGDGLNFNNPTMAKGAAESIAIAYEIIHRAVAKSAAEREHRSR